MISLADECDRLIDKVMVYGIGLPRTLTKRSPSRRVRMWGLVGAVMWFPLGLVLCALPLSLLAGTLVFGGPIWWVAGLLYWTVKDVWDGPIR